MFRYYIDRHLFPSFRQLPEKPNVLKCRGGKTLLVDGWVGKAPRSARDPPEIRPRSARGMKTCFVSSQARKIHYTMDALMALVWALTCGITSFAPFVYFFFYSAMCSHRTIRDEVIRSHQVVSRSSTDAHAFLTCAGALCGEVRRRLEAIPQGGPVPLLPGDHLIGDLLGDLRGNAPRRTVYSRRLDLEPHRRFLRRIEPICATAPPRQPILITTTAPPPPQPASDRPDRPTLRRAARFSTV